MRTRSGKNAKSASGEATTEILRSTRFTLLLLVHNCIFEALPDCVLSACDAMRRHISLNKFFQVHIVSS